MEINGRKKDDGVIAIFRQCVILQSKFNASRLHFPSRTKVTVKNTNIISLSQKFNILKFAQVRVFGWAMVLSICLVTVTRQVVFASKKYPWYALYARSFSRLISFGFWVPSNETSNFFKNKFPHAYFNFTFKIIKFC